MPTIAAIATPQGRGGIGIVRLSGPGAKGLLSRVFLAHSPRFVNFRPWTMHHGVVLDANDEQLDDVLAVYMPGPGTYTGEDVAEIHCHGGEFLVGAVLESLLRLGARLAQPGEFTRRAYLNGRLDLSQAEAVAELIAAPSREALKHGLARYEGQLAEQVRALKEETDALRALAHAGIDFPEDEIDLGDGLGRRIAALHARVARLLKGAARARLMQEGAKIALAGLTNAGKSSLLNALGGRERALVTDIPGTTRDFIEERLDLEGLPACVIDTAGLRKGQTDPVEALGIKQSRQIIAQADLVALVIDSSLPGEARESAALMEEFPDRRWLLVWNKIDLAAPDWSPPAWAASYPCCMVSALEGKNIDALAGQMRNLLLHDSAQQQEDMDCAPNRRQTIALQGALNELAQLMADLEAGIPADCCLCRLDAASAGLGEIVPLAADNELLDKIFSQFCVGK